MTEEAQFNDEKLRCKEMKSIRRKITVCLIATVVITMVAVGAVSITLTYRSTIATVDRMLSETAVLAAERIGQELTAYKNVAMDTGSVPLLTSASGCTASSGAMSSAWTVSVFLTERIIPTGNMYGRP